MTATRKAALDASYRRLLLAALGVHYPNTLSTAELFARTRLQPFTRSLLAPPLATLALSKPSERLRRGQGRTVTLATCLLADLHFLRLSLQEAATLDSGIFKARVFAA